MNPSQTLTWLTAIEAAAHARVSIKTIYREVRANRLRAAKVGGRKDLRFLESWINDSLIQTSAIEEKS